MKNDVICIKKKALFSAVTDPILNLPLSFSRTTIFQESLLTFFYQNFLTRGTYTS
jgi:hypothetical protein